MTSSANISALASLRGECLHLAVRMLAYGDAERLDPRDAIRLAEEYVVWILDTGRQDPAIGPGNGHPPDHVRIGFTELIDGQPRQ